jgi:hypothetical protein
MSYYFNEADHVHMLDGKPLTGTSSVMDVLAKPLTWWASGLAVEKLGWMNSKKKTDTGYTTVPEAERIAKARPVFDQINQWGAFRDDSGIKEYLKLLDEGYKAHSVKLKDSAGKGKDLHAELEKFVLDHMQGKEGTYEPKIKPFIDWTAKEVKRFLWSEANCYDEELWVGGISDAGAELNDGRYAVIDFKSSKEAYPNQFLQCAGYAIQIEKNGLWSPKGIKTGLIDKPIEALIIIPFGADIVEPVSRYDIESYKRGFRSAVDLYRLLGLEK